MKYQKKIWNPNKMGLNKFEFVNNAAQTTSHTKTFSIAAETRSLAWLMVLLLLLTSCYDQSIHPPLSPAECRSYGVQVNDNDTVTGKVVKSEFGTLGKMYKMCGDGAAGCARPANFDKVFPAPDHEYAVYYSESKCAPYHEECHAYYEIGTHTPKFVIRQIQGDILAACP